MTHSRQIISLAAAALFASASVAGAQVAPSPQLRGSFGQPLPPPPPAPPGPDGAAAPAAPAAAPVVRRRPPPAPARFAALPRDNRPTFTPNSVVNTEAAVARYRSIVQRGGWERVRPGDIDGIRERLAIEGDLGQDGNVQAAVRRFQMRHGLRETGSVAGPTLAAMNVPAETRLRQLEASLQRMRSSGFAFGQRYVVVNIPAAAVEAIESGQIRRRYVAVVGKADRASPPVETQITNVNFNPTWTVPASIIKKDIIPKMQRDRGYLSRSKIRILDGRGREINPSAIDWSSERAVNYTLRQDPGAGNSLGQVRIDMPNHLAVYMHDTPSKGLFASDNRFHSSGCVRVQDVRDLVTWLLADNGSWSRGETDAAIAEGERRDVRLARPVPVAWTYFTGYGMPDGSAHFRSDIYELDKGGGGLPVAVRTTPRGPQSGETSLATGALEPVPAPPPPQPQQPSFWNIFRPHPY
ncbi:MAG: L,D-transpeptidase family protein [Beijerinckiaceae bacterium]